MLAGIVKEFHKSWTLEQITPPLAEALSEHDLLIKVAVASYCHTDMMVLESKFHDRPSGLSGSHEPSGTIVAVGSQSVERFYVGDRVIAIGIRDPCGNCVDCNGPEEFRLSCKFNKGFAGISAPGAFQEYTIVDERFAVRIPDSLGFLQAAPLTCAGCTSWRAIKRANVPAGGWLGIVGSGGGLGHLAVQLATKQGINVIGVEAKDAGLVLTKKAGAGQTVDIRNGLEAAQEQVRAAVKTGGGQRCDNLCDAVIVLSEAKSALHTGMVLTKGHGTVIMVAQPDTVEFPFQQMIFRDIRLMGSNLSSQAELEELVNFVVANNVEVDLSVYHGLESLSQLYKDVISGRVVGKAVVVVDSSQV